MSANQKQRIEFLLNDGQLEVRVDGAKKLSGKTPVESPFPLRRWQHLVVTWQAKSTGELRVYRDARPLSISPAAERLSFPLEESGQWSIGGRADESGFRGMVDDVRIFSRALGSTEVQRLVSNRGIEEALAIPRALRMPEQNAVVNDFYLQNYDKEYRQLTDERASVQRQLGAAHETAPTTMVMQERTSPRETFVLLHGEFDQPGERVDPSTPTALLPWHSDAPRNRIGLARWLVDPANSLTARVTVNRIWQQFFGAGLVRTPEDFGQRGEMPSHPELLDWLAVEFMESGWDVKHVVRLIATSATYRQANRFRAELASTDPENRLLAVAPRIRLDAETVRDSALCVGDLLENQIGGPSVFPYQPDGLWEEISFNPAEYTAQAYRQSHGRDLYRRGLYTFWKRTLPHPMLATFDAPTREKCTIIRTRTNTPLQALVLMNEPSLVEAARQMAERILIDGGTTSSARIAWAFRLVTSRWPTNAESEALSALYERQFAHFRQLPDEAAKLLTVGETPRHEQLDPAQFAAWTTVANVLLCLDEVITRN